MWFNYITVLKTLSSIQDLLRHCNSGLQYNYCVSIKIIHETSVVSCVRHSYSSGEGFKIFTITGNAWGSKSIITLYFVALTGWIYFTKEVLFITTYRFGISFSANKSRIRNFHPTPQVLYQYFLLRALNNFTRHIFGQLTTSSWESDHLSKTKSSRALVWKERFVLHLT